jgi:protein-tyrosine-phosphatase
MMDAADKVIVMAERETWPEYLAEGGKVVSWKIDDPAGVSPDEMQVIMEQLKCKVRELVQEVG